MGDAAGPIQQADDLNSHLRTLLPDAAYAELRDSVLPALLDSLAAIARTLRQSQHVAPAGNANAFGDDQLNVDVLAEDLIRAQLTTCSTIVTASSEEDPVERPVVHSAEDGAAKARAATATEEQKETYTVAFDPLDGSSIIAPNWAVGTIIGVWAGRTALRQPPATQQIAALLGVFGPRAVAVVAVRLPGWAQGQCFEVGLGEEHGGGDPASLSPHVILRPAIRFAEPPFAGTMTRYFAPANLRAAAEDPAYLRLVTHFVQQRYTLRYSGGLVPDVVHALVKGHGVYVSPVTANSKAKLRRLYELYPLALVVECAGGSAIDPVAGGRILDRALEDLNETAGLVCGVREDVEFVREALCTPPAP